MAGEEENIGPDAVAAGKRYAAADPVSLAGDIDDLRRRMLETFLLETSFTADPVILISRQLDTKIVEYMKHWQTGRRKAR